jgi:hypothetical protein
MTNLANVATEVPYKIPEACFLHRAIVLFVCLASLFAIRTSEAEPLRNELFVFGPNSVYVPEGFFVLVRKGQEIGAFRLIKVEQGDPNGIGKSAYESYFQVDGSGSFLKPNVVRRSGEIDIKPMKGMHAFAWQPGQNRLRVGKWWFGCLANQLINMAPGFSERDAGYEFAPTSARIITEIDAADIRLRWFRFDPNNRISVPVAELPK